MTTRRIFGSTTVVGVLAAVVVSAGCGLGTAGPPAPAVAEGVVPREALEAEGARIWRMTCDQCHTLRLPEEYSAAQWDVIVSHMRTRADLTRSEAEAVRAFLREAAEG